MFSDGLAGKEYTLKLYVLNLVPVFNRIFYGRFSYINACAVNEDINMSEFFDNFIYKGVNAFLCGYIC